MTIQNTQALTHLRASTTGQTPIFNLIMYKKRALGALPLTYTELPMVCSEEHRSETGITLSSEATDIITMLPKIWIMLVIFCTEFMKKYGDKVDVFEFLERAYDGFYRLFWADTPESFRRNAEARIYGS